ncbi:MAG: hypothetical protein AB7U20_18215 [Planctomycetaceae bacterium]
MFRWNFVLSCGMLLAGCGDSGPQRVPVTGQIVLSDGKPVFPGSIAFVPQEGGEYQASTLLHEEGRFTMRTYPHGEGVVPGKYKVVLSLGMGSPAELAKYSNVKSSPLEVIVPETGLESVTLTLAETVSVPPRHAGPPGMQR